MSDTVIQVDDLWKKYRLGVLGTGSLRHDFNQWWHRVRGKPDPYAKVSERQHTEAKKPKERNGGANPESLPADSILSDDEMWALRGVSFEVKRGEILGIIGRNGAGKSTLLKILSRVTAPTTGEVRVKGRIARLLEVGTGFHPELTGRENIFLNGAILGMTKAEIKQKFDEIVDFSGVERHIDTPVKRYSSGMYVRLAFAVAAHLEPEILIVDEVLAVGDAEFQKKCIGKMQDVSRRDGRTVLFVSHNMSAVKNLCTRALLFGNGQLSFAGETAEALDQYSQQGLLHAGLVWERPSKMPLTRMGFQTIKVNLSGKTPQLRLKCELFLRSPCDSEDVFIAVDICDRSSTPIMQAIPAVKPFIDGKRRSIRLNLEVDLPALVPGTYAVDFWIGSHFSKTTDYAKGAVTFEIIESPTGERNHPHSADHGFIVPSSRCAFADADN